MAKHKHSDDEDQPVVDEQPAEKDEEFISGSSGPFAPDAHPGGPPPGHAGSVPPPDDATEPEPIEEEEIAGGGEEETGGSGF